MANRQRRRRFFRLYFVVRKREFALESHASSS
jgi:hypothetical protein